MHTVQTPNHNFFYLEGRHFQMYHQDKEPDRNGNSLKKKKLQLGVVLLKHSAEVTIKRKASYR